MLQDKSLLIEALENNIVEITENKNGIEEIKKALGENHGITAGRVEKVLNNINVLEEADARELALFTEQIYKVTGLIELKPTKWFTVSEMKTARGYDKSLLFENEIDSDIIFENVLIVDDKVMTTVIDIAKISELMDTQALYYDFNIQRQAKRMKDGINQKATVYKKNIKEIKEKMLSGKLKPTTIVFNAAVGSSDTGEELLYDSVKRTVTVSKGVRLAILDGYHRCLASIEAYNNNPNLKFRFILELTNYTTREAQEFQADHAKATPIPKARIQMFESKRHADTVTQTLMSDSELKNKVASQHRVSLTSGELVSYNVLTDAIEREFPMEFRRDTIAVADYLSEFFDELIAEYSSEFLSNKRNEYSLMSYNKMFAGYVALAANMKKEEISVERLSSILQQVNFSRENIVWKNLGVVDSEGKIKNSADVKKIANYFKNIKIN